MPTSRIEQSAAAIDGVIFVAGGIDDAGTTLTTFEAFDTATGTWSALPPLPEPRDHFGFAALDGRLYLSGGEILAEGVLREGLWVFDPAAQRWSTLAPMPGPRSQHGMAALGGKLYVVGGEVAGSSDRALWAYDPATGEWQTDLPEMPTERNHLSVAEADGRLFAVGGRVSGLGGSRNLTVVESYDPATNTWESLPEMPTGRGGMAAGTIDGRIHTGGGEDLASGSTHAEHEVFDTATGTWSVADDLPTPRHGIGSAVVDGRWYLIGGGTQAGLSTSDVVEVFSP